MYACCKHTTLYNISHAVTSVLGKLTLGVLTTYLFHVTTLRPESKSCTGTGPAIAVQADLIGVVAAAWHCPDLTQCGLVGHCDWPLLTVRLKLSTTSVYGQWRGEIFDLTHTVWTVCINLAFAVVQQIHTIVSIIAPLSCFSKPLHGQTFHRYRF